MPEKITKKAIDALRSEAVAQQKTRYLFDSELTGFGALATKTGMCSYFAEFRMRGAGGSSKRVTLGKHGALTPDEARKRAKEELGKVAAGKDIAQERKDARAKLKAGTFRDLSEEWFAAKGKQPKTGEWRSRRWREVHAMIDQIVHPTLGRKAPDAITKAELSNLIKKTKENSHSVARRLYETLRPLFKWAVGEGKLESNPLVGLECPKPETPRDRFLKDAEIKALWQVATEQSWPFENVIKLLLLTGQRRDEVARMVWGEVNSDKHEWDIPKERCKNKKAHTVDLHPEAVRLLDRLGEPAAARRASNEEFVFSTTGRTPVSGYSKVKRRIDARMQEILGDKFQPWRIHDLRRTAASGMAALGFQPHVIERVLNHVSGAQGGLVSVYQRHEYRDERKRAIMAWGDEVMRIVGSKEAPSNVVPLRVA